MMEFVVRGRFSRPVDHGAVGNDWQARGYSCNLFVDPPGQQWLDFVHATNELVTVVEGRLEVTISDDVLIAEEGDEIFIPRGAQHSVRNIHSGTSRWLFGYD